MIPTPPLAVAPAVSPEVAAAMQALMAAMQKGGGKK